MNHWVGRACPQRAGPDVFQARGAARRDGLALPSTRSWAVGTARRPWKLLLNSVGTDSTPSLTLLCIRKCSLRDAAERVLTSSCTVCAVRKPCELGVKPTAADGLLSTWLRWFLWICLSCLAATTVIAEDEIELLSGNRIQGKIIERTAQSIKIQITVEKRPLVRSYPLNRVRAITQNGQRQILVPTGKEASNSAPAAASRPASVPGKPPPIDPGLDSQIDQMGRTPPDWFDATPLEYPDTLDLSWPEPAPVIWNYTRNVDHYLWDIISSNPRRYRSGVRFMHHVLNVNQQNEGVRARAINELGRMYFEFFRDYARAAFWWRQAKVDQNPKFTPSPSAAHLAECYWRLGSRSSATSLLEQLPLTPAVIKAWADLKETEKALCLCDEALKLGLPPSQIYLLAGDACRAARDFSKATEFYQKVLGVPKPAKPDDEIKRDQERAAATLEVIRLFDTLDVSRIPDGSYPGKSLGYYGHLEVEAIVKAKRIEDLKVTYNPDRQYFHAVDESIRRILERQTVNGVDAISGATVTSEAVIRAAAKALASGMSTNAAERR